MFPAYGSDQVAVVTFGLKALLPLETDDGKNTGFSCGQDINLDERARRRAVCFGVRPLTEAKPLVD